MQEIYILPVLLDLEDNCMPVVAVTPTSVMAHDPTTGSQQMRAFEARR